MREEGGQAKEVEEDDVFLVGIFWHFSVWSVTVKINACIYVYIYIYIYFIYVIYIHTYKHTYIYIPQQRDIYETVIFRFLQIFYGRFVRYIYIYIYVCIYI